MLFTIAKMEELQLSRQAMCDELFKVHKDERTIECLMRYVRNEYPDLEDYKLELIEKKLKLTFFRIFQSKLSSVFYKENLFRSKNITWLSGDVCINFNEEIPVGGRPSIENYEECSTSTKRRKIQALTDSYSEEEIKQAFYKNLRDSGKQKFIKIIENILKNDDDTAYSLTEAESLALIEDAKLSKWQYDTIRKRAKEKNADIFIPYKKLSEAKKECYPASSSISITEKGASIDLQALLNHTCTRLFKIPTILSQLPEDKTEVSLTLSVKWGCDGASDQSEYKQRFSDGTIADSSIFMISMVPLSLNLNIENNQINLWRNPNSGSTRYCRVISFEYAKETPQKTRNEVDHIQTQIDLLLSTVIEVNGKKIEVKHDMYLTMLDGKVIQGLTETPSSASCVICQATPSLMNDLEGLKNRIEIEDNYKYGLSSLHAWIRLMECVIHIAYRLNFQKWSVRSEEDKIQLKEMKQRIQKEFKERTGLLIDYPKQGAGNSNDGNTARRFVRDPNLTSEITGVDTTLIVRFGVILQTLACGVKIDTAKFQIYATETAELYVKLYGWFYMPASVHKILIHGAKIIDNFGLVPIGLLSEESQESRNKDLKHYRKFNTRKCSRVDTNCDLIHKLLISSDPYISSLRYKMKNTKIEIDKAAKEMLIEE